MPLYVSFLGGGGVKHHLRGQNVSIGLDLYGKPGVACLQTDPDNPWRQLIKKVAQKRDPGVGLGFNQRPKESLLHGSNF